MTYKITLTTLDNQEFTFDCQENQTVQDAAEAAHLYPPFGCKSGACGACAGHCEQGTYTLDEYNELTLSKESAAKGDILLCRTLPSSDLRITTHYNADAIKQSLSVARDADIIAIEQIAERTLKLSLQLHEDADIGLAFEFEPGQFVELETPDNKIMRAYSIANTVNWEGRLEFLIRLQKNGQFCTFLNQAHSGQTLKVHAASGAFVLQKQSLRPRCFIAGGTGIAPFMSMLRRMAEWNEDFQTTLFFGVNNEAEIFCQDVLKQLQQALPQLSVEICVWKPENNWQGFIGTPVDAFKAYLENQGTNCDVYLCGPPILVETGTEVAHNAGIDAQHIYSERFV